MDFSEYGRMAVRNLSRRRKRSFLTVLGIIIGITIVVAFISLGDGMRNAITGQLSALGSDVIMVTPGQFGSTAALGGVIFDQSDVDTVAGTPGIRAADLEVIGSLVMEFKGTKKVVTAIGGEEALQEIAERSGQFPIGEGRWPVKKEKGVLIGHKIAATAFDDEIRLKERVLLNGEPYTVVGILSERGQQQADRAVILEREALVELTDNQLGMANLIAQLDSGADPERTAEAVKKNLKRKRGAEDFTVMNPKKAQEAVGGVLGVLQLFLTAIASIALVVGGIGIMNTMYTSVMERTREIGTIKAIGACGHEILYIFLLEAGMLGILGGVVGTAIGLGFAKLIEIIAQYAGYRMLKVLVTPEVLVIGIGFAFVIGVVSGVLPARQASQLDPVEALRWE